MSPRSTVLFEANDFEREPEVRGARSNGYLDYLEEQEKWNRLDKERQMVRYRDGKHHGATRQRVNADRLAVPVDERSPGRPRALSDIGSRTDESSQPFHTREVSSRPRSFGGRMEQGERVFEESRSRASNHPRSPVFERPKSKMPPVVIQKDPPGQRVERSPGRGPRSPSGQPKLQYKYLLLQNKLADISLACVRYIDVEAADPRDLTFEKIAEHIKGFQFELQVWSNVANIENVARRDVPEDAKAVIEAASRNMDRLIERAIELHDACSEAKPSDLKYQDLPKVDDNEAMFGETGNEQSEQDLTESMSYIINASLHSIKLQLQNLKRLTRSLQEATPDAKHEMKAVFSLVTEVNHHFGSEDALNRNPVDKKFSGRRALEEARFAAAR